jgi:hypothetical protein
MEKPLTATIILHNNKGQIPETSVRKDGMIIIQTPAINRVSLFYSYGVDGSGPIELQGNGIDFHHVGDGTVIVMPTLDLVPEGDGWQPFPIQPK